jgi:hypothetical protein
MVVLGVLIILALITAVASILIVGAQWLLLITAALLIAAFAYSLRSARQQNWDAPGSGTNTALPPENRMVAAHNRGVYADSSDLFDLTGRHRDQRNELTELRADVSSSAPEQVEFADRG